MKRRTFIAGLGYAAAWPVAARAQQAAVPTIGWLDYLSPEAERDNLPAFQQGLAETGYVEGRNVIVEYRWAENYDDRLSPLAADLVRRRVAVIVAMGTTSALAAKAATQTIPIVFSTGADPVASGLVASLNRPGGNVTGSASLLAELVPKRLQLLREVMPNATVFGLLTDPSGPGVQSRVADLQAAARTLGLQLIIEYARTDSDLEPAFATFSQQRVGAVLVVLSAQLAVLAARHALPAIFTSRRFVLAGGLMSYGSSRGYFQQQVGLYTGRILKGEKPA